MIADFGMMTFPLVGNILQHGQHAAP